MIITPKVFPSERRHDPKRQAEAAVFDALAGSEPQRPRPLRVGRP